MKITEKQQDWIKIHQGMLRQILNERLQDYFNKVVDEENPQRKEVLSLMVKELRMTLTTIDNLCNLKDKKKETGETYTGV